MQFGGSSNHPMEYQQLDKVPVDDGLTDIEREAIFFNDSSKLPAAEFPSIPGFPVTAKYFKLDYGDSEDDAPPEPEPEEGEVPVPVLHGQEVPPTGDNLRKSFQQYHDQKLLSETHPRKRETMQAAWDRITSSR